MSETVDWTLEDLARTLREVAAEQPDYVYVNEDLPEGSDSRNCKYWHENTRKPGCILGVALHRLGVDVASMFNVGIVIYLGERFPSETIERRRPFRYVQMHQDGSEDEPRLPWGECIKALDEMYPAIDSGAVEEK